MEQKNIINISNIFEKDIINVKNIDDIEKLEIKYLSRNGIINKQLKNIKVLSCEDKKQFGKQINILKTNIFSQLKVSKNKFKKDDIKKYTDITLPGIGLHLGIRHIINKTINDIEKFFLNLGFKTTSGYEIDTDYYNFQALNMPKTHPSRNMHETFYITDNLLLRTHTSNMQIHVMKKNKPPFKILSYGKVYRRDSDISHTPMFHQIEGFVINKNVSFSNLKFLLTEFLNFYFDENIEFRMRSSYFPFTEPSVEVDIKCVNCLGKTCPTCKYSGWVEILGCGIVHPNVLKNCNIDNKLYGGFAFGLGVERLAMIKYNINDLRLYFDNNIDFLSQF